MSTGWLLALAVGAAVLSGSSDAHAYPFFQITSGTDVCSACHVSPSGGGLLTSWGRFEAGDTVSRGGDGAFMHGAVDLPDWLLLQGEFRLAGLANDTGGPEGAELAVFPMQTDVLAGVAIGELTAVASVGYRGQVREPEDPDSEASQIDDQDALSFLISREHYVMYKAGGRGPYARVGRFYAPFGLRVADHTSYIRRYLGTNLMEETYGLSAGWISGRWEGHATAFASDPLRGNGYGEVGGAALLEFRVGNHVMAAQARVTSGEADWRGIAGGYAKVWLEELDLLLMGELDVGRQGFDDAGGRWQVAARVGPVYRPLAGLYAGAHYELFDSDLSVARVARHALAGWLSYFPYAHLELALSIRGQRIGNADGAGVGLLQLHYYL